MIGPMPEPVSGMPAGPTRRAALAGVGAAVVALPLAACGIRLEDDAPRLPLVPTREPVPAESFLLEVWTGSAALAEQAAAIGAAAGSLPARLAQLHREQAGVMRAVLVRLGVPESVLEKAQQAAVATSAPSTGPSSARTTPEATVGSTTQGPGSTTGGPGSTTTEPTSPATAGPSPASLGEAEARLLTSESFVSLAELDDTTVAVAGALLAQRAAAASLLGEEPGWAREEWSEPGLASALLETLRSAAYGFEVVAAQSKGAQAALAKQGLATLRQREAELEQLAGAQAAPPALGYPLPFRVATPGDARRLAVHVLTGLRESVAAQLTAADGRAQPLAALTRRLAETEVLASRWGIALEAFPGLR